MGSVPLTRRNFKRRTKSEDKDKSCNTEYYSSSSGTSYSNKPYLLDNYSLVGWDIPDFHKRVNRGELLPQTPFDRQQVSGVTDGSTNVWKDPGDYQYYVVSGVHHKFDYWLPDEDVGTSISEYLAEARIGFAQEAAAKIYSSGHDTLTFLAELASVRRMFLNVGKRLLGSLHLLPKGTRGVSGDWLSYRYGWRTLIYDLQDLNKAIIGLDSGRKRHSERAGTTYSRTSTNAFDGEVSSRTRHHVIDDKIEFRLSGSVVADVSIPQFQFNPLQTGWEIIPFSFVIDWFVNVGKTLSAWSFLSLDMSYAASYGIQVTMTRNYNMSVTWKSPYTGTEWQTGTSEIVASKRIPCQIPYLPQPRLNLNPFKILDLLGLIVQRK